MTTDLDQIRAWRKAAPNRALVLAGVDGKNGVDLISFANGTRNRARYDSVSAAAVALAAGKVRFRPYADVVPGSVFMNQPVARRGRPRKRR